MSRRVRAIVTTLFSYAQTAIAVIAAVVVTPFVLNRLGAPLYGLWLASSALFAYASFADFGVFRVLPWLVADIDGRKRAPELKGLTVNGLLIGAAAGVLYLATAVALWLALPAMLHAQSEDRARLFVPLALVVAVTALAYPLRLFVAINVGLQDATFTGIVNACQPAIASAIVLILASRGHALLGLALGAAVPTLWTGLAAFARTLRKRRALLRGMPRPTWKAARPILSGAGGTWLNLLGLHLLMGSDAIVIGVISQQALIAPFAMTSRIGQMLMQVGWTLPEHSLVGLVQLKAEGHTQRVTEVTGALLRMYVLSSGAVACVVLSANPGLVRMWVGEPLFGGFSLNCVFAADIVILSVANGIMSISMALGDRAKAGSTTLLNGALHFSLAVLLGRTWGLVGVACSTFVSVSATMLPLGLRWLEASTGLSPRTFLRETLRPWATRSIPVLVFSGWLGRESAHEGFWTLSVRVALVCLAYVFVNRRLVRELPAGDRVRRALALLRLA